MPLPQLEFDTLKQTRVIARLPSRIKVHMQNPLMTLQTGRMASRIHLHADPSFRIIQVTNPTIYCYNYHLPQVFSVALSVDGFRSRGHLLLIVLYVHYHFFAACGFLYRRRLRNSVMLLLFACSRWISVMRPSAFLIVLYVHKHFLVVCFFL